MIRISLSLDQSKVQHILYRDLWYWYSSEKCCSTYCLFWRIKYACLYSSIYFTNLLDVHLFIRLEFKVTWAFYKHAVHWHSAFYFQILVVGHVRRLTRGWCTHFPLTPCHLLISTGQRYIFKIIKLMASERSFIFLPYSSWRIVPSLNPFFS